MTSTYFTVGTKYTSQVNLVFKAFVSHMYSANMIEASKVYDHEPQMFLKALCRA